MILDLQAFIAGEEKHWSELEAFLDRLDRDPRRRLSMDEIRRVHYLYERASSAIGKISTFASESVSKNQHAECAPAPIRRRGGRGRVSWPAWGRVRLPHQQRRLRA